jgi:hypothetical protein
MTLAVNWMNGGSAPEGASGDDLLVGQGSTTRTVIREFADGTSVSLIATPELRWVVPAGGGFFFAPAKSVFARLNP